MKYVILESNKQEDDELFYDVADFFWNNGNEVHITDKNNRIDREFIGENSYCIVLLIYGSCCEKYVFEKGLEKLYKDFELDKSDRKNVMLIFTPDGVFTNVIPSPYKIFEFANLDKNELLSFFNWCNKFNLFTKQTK